MAKKHTHDRCILANSGEAWMKRKIGVTCLLTLFIYKAISRCYVYGTKYGGNVCSVSMYAFRSTDCGIYFRFELVSIFQTVNNDFE